MAPKRINRIYCASKKKKISAKQSASQRERQVREAAAAEAAQAAKTLEDTKSLLTCHFRRQTQAAKALNAAHASELAAVRRQLKGSSSDQQKAHEIGRLNSSLQEKLASSEAALGKQLQELEKADGRVRALEAEVQSLKGHCEDLRAEKSRLSDQLGQQRKEAERLKQDFDREKLKSQGAAINAEAPMIWEAPPEVEAEAPEELDRLRKELNEALTLAEKTHEAERLKLDEEMALETKRALRRLKVQYKDLLPKRPPTALQLFTAKFKALSEAEKKPFLDEMEKARQVFKEEKATWLRSSQGKLFEKKKKQIEAEKEKWLKTGEGKKYTQQKNREEKKKKEDKAREKYLTGPNAPVEPEKPKSAQFLFVEERKPRLLSAEPSLGVREVNSRLTQEWVGLDLSAKQSYMDRTSLNVAAYDRKLEAIGGRTKKRGKDAQKTKRDVRPKAEKEQRERRTHGKTPMAASSGEEEPKRTRRA